MRENDKKARPIVEKCQANGGENCIAVPGLKTPTPFLMLFRSGLSGANGHRGLHRGRVEVAMIWIGPRSGEGVLEPIPGLE